MREKEKYVYKITNKINNKCYIGQSIHPEQRFTEHARGQDYKSKISFAINKYGQENFNLEILYYGEDYNNQEQEYIKKFDSIKNGYNIAIGGENPPVWEKENHPLSKLTKEEAENIKQMLKQGVSIDIICSRHPQITRGHIIRINKGEAWRDENINYPIMNYEVINNSNLPLIIADIKNTKLSLKEIGKKYNLCKSSIVNINQGRHFLLKNSTETFPLRQSTNIKITKEEVVLIKTLLIKGESFKDIRAKITVNLPTLHNINNGKIYIDDTLTYPLNPKERTRLSNATIDNIRYSLLNTTKTFKEIATEFNTSVSSICCINWGRTYREDNCTYPLRQIQHTSIK